MSNFKQILLLGTGPATIQLAVCLNKQLSCRLGIAGRASARSEQLYSALKQSNQRVRVSVQNDNHREMEGECLIDQLFQDFGTITGEWDTLILAITTDAYIEVLQQVSRDVLKGVKCIVLISPTLGSNSLVRNYMKQLDTAVEIISFSTYFGDTRWIPESAHHHVLTTAVKKKIFAGSTWTASDNLEVLRQIFERSGIVLERMETPIEAESRNISLYVHPALFMNEFSLDAIFGDSPIQKYVYKMYPEGPITQYLIRDMLAQWKEIMNMLDALRIKRLNLLQFMTDDNYPVRLGSLSRDDIENFSHFETIHQEYLLYIRYTSLLIDPFSEPNEDGKYFDFSAVPFRNIFMNKEGELDIPRMPKEDYYRIKIIQGMMTHLGLPCPTIDKFLHTYERKLVEAAGFHQKLKQSAAFATQSFNEDIQRICSEINKEMQEEF
ncbi:opine metallophore biosynthesis dehydrogenase [Paenibacillus alba]|uniref:opine metallophore biosynthesis dehydrogenase n=1 Tax=Paenibacillus alba TaxID=1197127 RepID=UPI0015661EC6|nr:opine metallophore biosynthesis dehydrogenase [Paenibacillus alba]NQX66002.1 opine metallophore biosynthesis dehydrogenase [Paenibacillus alba]